MKTFGEIVNLVTSLVRVDFLVPKFLLGNEGNNTEDATPTLTQNFNGGGGLSS